MSRLYFLRHGQTDWNAKRRLQGQTDRRLDEEGRAQAGQAAALIAGLDFDHRVSSDLLRATETAAMLGQGEFTFERGWREAHVGDWAGQYVDDLRSARPDVWRGWRAGEVTPPDGESGDAFRQRIANAIAAIPQDRQRVLIVTHGGVVRTALSIILGLPADRLAPVPPGSVTIVETGQWPRLRGYGISGRLGDAPD